MGFRKKHGKINIKIIRDKSGFIRQFEIHGHSGYSEKGSDIICAGVSVTIYTAIGALEDLAGVRCSRTEDEEKGLMICGIPENIPESSRKTAGIILETTAIGFKQLELSYGEYVAVSDEEV